MSKKTSSGSFKFSVDQRLNRKVEKVIRSFGLKGFYLGRRNDGEPEWSIPDDHLNEAGVTGEDLVKRLHENGIVIS